MTEEKLKRVKLWQKETHKLIDEEKEKFPPIDPSKFNITESGQVVKEPVCKEQEMTYKEKAEEYINKRPFIHLLGRNTFFIQKEFKDAILWALEEGRKERNCVNCSNHGKQFEVMKLEKENAKLKAVCDYNCPDHKLATHNACLLCPAIRNSPYHDLKNVSDEELQIIIKNAEIEAEM